MKELRYHLLRYNICEVIPFSRKLLTRVVLKGWLNFSEHNLSVPFSVRRMREGNTVSVIQDSGTLGYGYLSTCTPSSSFLSVLQFCNLYLKHAVRLGENGEQKEEKAHSKVFFKCEKFKFFSCENLKILLKIKNCM